MVWSICGLLLANVRPVNELRIECFSLFSLPSRCCCNNQEQRFGERERRSPSGSLPPNQPAPRIWPREAKFRQQQACSVHSQARRTRERSIDACAPIWESGTCVKLWSGSNEACVKKTNGKDKCARKIVDVHFVLCWSSKFGISERLFQHLDRRRSAVNTRLRLLLTRSQPTANTNCPSGAAAAESEQTVNLPEWRTKNRQARVL